MLVIVLCQAIRLMHPMAPFITEELFHILKEQLQGLTLQHASDPYTQECIRALQSPACLVAPFPQVIRSSDLNPEIDQTFALMEQVVYTIRNIRGEMKLSPGTATDVYIIGQADDLDWQIVQSNIHLIAALVRTQKIEVLTSNPKLGFTCTGAYHALKIILPLPEEMLKQELQRLSKERDKLSVSLEKLRTQLANIDFVSRAPAHLIEKQQQQLAQGERELEEILRKLHSF
jgi:valyl-tRNA synthetase